MSADYGYTNRARSFSRDLRKSREAGFSDHIVKPPDFVQLERMIRRVVAKG